MSAPPSHRDKTSLRDLFTRQVTSGGRGAQDSKPPATVFVMAAGDIRRSGAASIPKARVSGRIVQQVDSPSWVISPRASARLFADKMIVSDGRSQDTPLFVGAIQGGIDISRNFREPIEVRRAETATRSG